MLFREIDGASETQLRGAVYAVELSHNGPHRRRRLLTPLPMQSSCGRVREARIQQLLSPDTIPLPGGHDDTGDAETANRRRGGLCRGPVQPRNPSSVLRMSPKRLLPHRHHLQDLSQCRRNPTLSDWAFASRSGPTSAETRATPFYLHPSNTRSSHSSTSGSWADLRDRQDTANEGANLPLDPQAPNRTVAKPPKFLIFDYKRDYTKPDFCRPRWARGSSTPNRIPLNIFDLRAAGDHTPSRASRTCEVS